MKTGDHEHPLVGRIRAWDALIILHRLPVSPVQFISHLFFFPASFTPCGFGPGFFSFFAFYFYFSLIERGFPDPFSLDPHFMTPD